MSDETTVTNNEGRKFDNGKPMMSLVPPWALEEIAKVMTMGAKKYAKDNWKLVPDGRQRYIDAMLRHINAFQKGEINDPEMGTHHLAHAACCLMFILDSDVSGVPLVDKPNEYVINLTNSGGSFVSNNVAQCASGYGSFWKQS